LPLRQGEELRKEEIMRILVVDDDYHDAEQLSSFARKEGIEVRVLNNLTEAVRVLMGEMYDVLFLDMHLPDLNSGTALSLLNEVAPRTPVILLANQTAVYSTHSLLQAGAFRVLEKPLVRETLLSAIEEARALRRAGPSGTP
jgi:DNA-binding NtrC family response regulator